ncbi:sensor histidine kinase [Salisediminibacterium beveridgei]|uniref:histidine kinase n=1 Tax=Salisediminibacterium beveridgei TaxID=632773 RepID=A0A1D7QXT5_9BACI|nr:ATP-binding protein [Salisediminibacterium beveridgei]AOM83814.1 putative sensor-like histidine kinase [Salisediminibacterium beveridgei]
MENYYFFLYLIYGLVYIAMGIYVSGRKRASTVQIPLIRSLIFLAGFGVLHGLSEWMTMVVITGMYDNQYEILFYIKQFLKALSFVSLFLFGLNLLIYHNKNKRRWMLIPWLVFICWASGMYYLSMTFGASYPIEEPAFNTVVLRYLMGLPAGIMAGIALFRHSFHFQSGAFSKMRGKYHRLAILFLLYALIDGVFVREMAFFPADMINNVLFFEITGIPIQVLKILVGVGILYVTALIIDAFEKEKNDHIDTLNQHKIMAEERQKLGVEVHDSIIQHMYAASLKAKIVKNQLSNQPGQMELCDLLEDTQQDLGEAMSKTREFIKRTTMTEVEMNQLTEKIDALIEECKGRSGLDIRIDGEHILWEAKLSAKTATDIYYLIQEALNNAVKHAKARIVVIRFNESESGIRIQIKDDGIGIHQKDLDKQGHMGMQLMRERAHRVGGNLEIERLKQGTAIKCFIPWRDSHAS